MRGQNRSLSQAVTAAEVRSGKRQRLLLVHQRWASILAAHRLPWVVNITVLHLREQDTRGALIFLGISVPVTMRP